MHLRYEHHQVTQAELPCTDDRLVDSHRLMGLIYDLLCFVTAVSNILTCASCFVFFVACLGTPMDLYSWLCELHTIIHIFASSLAIDIASRLCHAWLLLVISAFRVVIVCSCWLGVLLLSFSMCWKEAALALVCASWLQLMAFCWAHTLFSMLFAFILVRPRIVLPEWTQETRILGSNFQVDSVCAVCCWLLGLVCDLGYCLPTLGNCVCLKIRSWLDFFFRAFTSIFVAFFSYVLKVSGCGFAATSNIVLSLLITSASIASF